MLVKLLLKIVFKASLPIVAVAGVLSYGLYLKGGDPMSMWSTIASRTVGSIRDSGANTVQSVKALAPAGSSSKTSTTVYTWVDASGTTHFGSTPPIGVAAKSMKISTSSSAAVLPAQPSTMATTIAPTKAPTTSAALPRQESLDQAEQTENLPGMAGVKLPVNIQPEDLGLTRDKLLKMIGQ